MESINITKDLCLTINSDLALNQLYAKKLKAIELASYAVTIKANTSDIVFDERTQEYLNHLDALINFRIEQIKNHFTSHGNRM